MQIYRRLAAFLLNHVFQCNFLFVREFILKYSNETYGYKKLLTASCSNIGFHKVGISKDYKNINKRQDKK